MIASINSMRKSGLLLAFFAFISVILVVSTNNLTKESIIKNDEILFLKLINEILPPDQYDNKLADTSFVLPAKDSGLEDEALVYLATLKGKPITAFVQMTTLRGYNVITLLVGVNAKDQTLTGVRVIRHTETPGLGDKIEIKKSDWILSFDDKSLTDPQLSRWAVKKDGGDFDQFTGATITPRAIVNTVKSILLYTNDNLNKLFEKDLKAGDDNG